MANKTPWKKIVSDPDFLGEADFGEGEEKIVTIKKVSSGVKVKTADGASEKAVVYFQEDVKPMILNVARSKAITKVAGSRYVEDWAGVPIQLYIDDNVRAFGDVVSAVRVRPRKPTVQKTTNCSECGNPILPALGKSAEYIAVHTKKNYGAPLCHVCAPKRAAQAAQQAQKPTNSGGVEEDAQTHIDG